MKETKKSEGACATALRILSATAVPATLALTLILSQPHSASAQGDDADADGMPDLWEAAFGLDSKEPLDAQADPDADGLGNLAEMERGTDPLAADTDRDGFLDGKDDAPLSRVFIEWGSPYFTKADKYSYPAPAWFVGAFQKGGKWKGDEDKNGWQGGHAGEKPMAGSLALVVNPVLVDADLTVEADLEDEPGGDLRAGLLDAEGAYAVQDLAGNLITGGGGEKRVKFKAPLKDNHTAVAVVFYRKGGKVTVYRTMAYVDEDGDGLDREQEKQLGTSDQKTDSDEDGLDDYAEVFKHGTDANFKDTDGDGMPDGWEVANKLNPKVKDGELDADSDGLSNLKEWLLKSDPNALPVACAEEAGWLVVGTPLEAEPGAPVKAIGIYEGAADENALVFDKE